jgi:uncharacterized protein (TIGR02444 family)
LAMKPQASNDGARMSDLSELSIWDFALAWYQKPGVEGDCLAAQDIYGLDVTALIFALYRSRRQQGFDAAVATELSRALASGVVEPLRAARMSLKAVQCGVDSAASETLRHKVKEAELDAERLTLMALDSMPVYGLALPGEAALEAIADVRQIVIVPDLAALLKRLAMAAQNM